MKRSHGFLQKHFHSLPTRLLGVFIIQAILTMMLLGVVGIFVMKGKAEQRIPLLLEDYIERLLVEAPQPMTRGYLFELQSETGLQFGYQQNNQWQFLSHSKLQRLFEQESDDDDWHRFQNHNDWKWKFDRGHLLAVLPYQQGDLWIHFGLRKKNDNSFGFWLSVTVILSMLIMTYLWVRRLLKPIRHIQKGVDRYAEGGFDYRLKAKPI